MKICRVLLQHGALARLALTREFFARPSARLLRRLIHHGVRPQSLLRPILMEGNAESARVLLELGVEMGDPDKRGFTPLHWAAHNSVAMVRLVARQPNAFKSLSRGGGHALGFCALWGYTGRLKALLEAGFPVDTLQQNPAESALFAACREGNPGCVRVLLKFGANPNLRCGAITPLMAASHSGSLACVEMLLEAGADPEATDDRGRKARAYAVTPPFLGQHRWGQNSAGEPRVELSYGRGRWTCGHKAIAAKLPGDEPIGESRILSSDGRRLRSMDFAPFHSRYYKADNSDCRILQRAAAAGCAEAQCLWGFYTGKLGWLQASAAQKWAQGELGQSGIRFDPDGRMPPCEGPQEERPATGMAAELGHLGAMRDLAAHLIHYEYERTGSFAEGFARALPWYCRAAERGHPESLVAAGSMLIEGDGAEPDPRRGLRFLEAAARSADSRWAPAAARGLACYYKGCDSLPADPEKAAYWEHQASIWQWEDDLSRDQFAKYRSRLRSP